ncbi:uracil phosphoribosyltransferase protein [Coniochaeta hoffmannii]|uniref:Uracil phosphoribosyltransferase protein n=1 Tax=Coniochaeta hoffmannii TaxID=91930 RepID=A0AA38RU62_9PEZI|nr:uracil phosphoribosyltransferase protein [Coniochaeta hoffmannii]
MANPSGKKPVVVGLYGISGCGKTYLLKQLQQTLSQKQYLLFEGSEVLDSVVPGGLESFQQLSRDDQTSYREQAIRKIGRGCATHNRAGIVTGHFMFWKTDPTDGGNGDHVATPADLATYTHILYLNIPIDSIDHYRREDTGRCRGEWMAPDVLRKWRDTEKRELRRLCAERDILFSLVSGSPDYALQDRVRLLLEDFLEHTPELNLARAKREMDEFLLPSKGQLHSVLLLDADRTLTIKDTGRLFWELVRPGQNGEGQASAVTVKDVFSGPLGYSYNAFRQAALLYEEVSADQDFNWLCDKVQSQVQIDPNFITLLKLAADKPHVGTVVVTSGLGRLWDVIVARAGLSKTVKVIGGGRISDGFVVTAGVKAGLVDHLHFAYDVRVSAFGDSPLDLPMLTKADEAIVVVCPEDTRSKTMGAALSTCIKNGFRPRQTMLPDTGDLKPLLNTVELPIVYLNHKDTIDWLLRPGIGRNRLLHATDRTSAKILMTPTRDASIAGPVLREAHLRIGQYLATEFVTDIVGLDEYPMPHVQGSCTTGYRLRNEDRTTVVALLRGGEPMAFGVSAAFPRAMFVHAKAADDIRLEHVRGQSNIVLVDSVVNNGTTVMEFLGRLEALGAAPERIVVVAGVVQSGAVSGESPLWQALGRDRTLSVVALRLSDNKFTGKGTTDTGNRLFNTTRLD